MGNVVAVLLAFLALVSRRFQANLKVAWLSPFGWLVPAAAALVVWKAPQMPDMIAGLAEDSQRRPMFGFAFATVLLGWSGWHWMRAAIAARLGAETREEWRRAAADRAVMPSGDAAMNADAVGTAPRLAIIAAGALAGVTLLVSYTADPGGFLLDLWKIAVLAVAIGAGWLLPVLRRKAVESEWFRKRVLQRRWFRWLHLGSGHGKRAWPPAESFGKWASELWAHFLAILHAAPFGAPFAALLLLLVPAAVAAVAWAPERLPAAPTAALLALACLVPPLTLLHALLARLPVPKPNGMALAVVLAMLFVAPWNPPSIYSARQMAEDTAGKAASRPELPQAFQAWRDACLPGAAAAAPMAVVIVAGEGGASRGALWLLSVMRHLDERTDGAFGRHVFAVSAVSGGSLGAATYLAAHRAAPGDNGCGVDWKRVAAGGKDPLDGLVRRDFLAPSVATYLLSDTLRRLLPLGFVVAPFGPDDRAVALERAFERYWGDSFPGLAPEGGLLDVRPPTDAKAPHLLLNGTDAEAGRRVITATFRFGSDPRDTGDAVVEATGDVLFADADDMLGIVRRDVPLSAAVTNSARFPFINPAGRFLSPAAPEGESGGGWRAAAAEAWAWVRKAPCRAAEWWSRSDWAGACDPRADLRQVVDGGYFENYGALTALELARKLQALGGGAIRPVVVVVSNDADRPGDAPDLDIVACDNARPAPARPDKVQVRNWRQGDPAAFSEVLAPLLGLYATRAAHGAAALHALRRELCEAPPAAAAPGRRDLVHIALPKPNPDNKEAAPMNWVLNGGARRLLLETGLHSAFNRGQTELLRCSLDGKACPPAEGPADSKTVAGRRAAPAADVSGAPR